MKIAFLTPLADIATAAIMMENQFFLVTDIFPICESFSQAKTVAGGVDQVATYINIRKLVQAAGSLAGGVLTPSSNFQVLDNTNVNAWENFQYTTVQKFMRGRVYLIPVGQFAPLNLTPNFMFAPVGGNNTVNSATKFMYVAPDDTDILNDVDIPGCIVVEHKMDVSMQANIIKNQNKLNEIKSIALGQGVPAQLVLNFGTPVPDKANPTGNLLDVQTLIGNTKRM